MTNGQFFSMQRADTVDTVQAAPLSTTVMVPTRQVQSAGGKGTAQSIGITEITLIELKERIVEFVLAIVVLVLVAVLLMKAGK